MIRLDYYRLLPDTQYIGVVEEPDSDCRFSPYFVFVLETRLYPLIYKLFKGIFIEILLKSEYNNHKNRMDIYLVIRKLENTTDPFIENTLVNMTSEQREIIVKKINEITSYEPNYALIDVNQLYNSIPLNVKRSNYKIPFSYFSTMLQYTGIDSSYNPFIRPEGIYLTFNPNAEYKKAYYEVCKFLANRIQEFYDKGAIVFGNLIDDNKKQELIKNWDLVSIDEEEIIKTIFEPNWIDERFAKNKVDFLTRKLQGDNFIRLKVSDNFVKRHGITTILQNHNHSMIFEGSYLKVEAKNLQEAYSIASLVDYATGTTNGKVMVLAASQLSEIYLYFEYANILFKESVKKSSNTDPKGIKNNAVTYSVSNNENPYVFSCMVPFNEKYVSLDDLRLSFRNYAVKRLIEVSKVSKFQNMSPHSIIEQEYSSQ